MSMMEHFKAECDLVGWNRLEDPEEREMQQLIIANVNEVLKVISAQGHSGHSFPYFFNLLEKAANFKPLTPLTGEDSEWNQISENLWQNKRCPGVFSEGDTAYNIDGYVFREPGGCCFTSIASRKGVSFPYTPEKPVYLDVPEGAEWATQEYTVRNYEAWQALLTRLEAIPLELRADLLAPIAEEWEALPK